MKFSKSLPPLDIKKEVDFLVDFTKDQLKNRYNRDGIVVGISGGIDSAVTAAISLKVAGREKVAAVIMPEKESNPISAKLAVELAEKLGLDYQTRDITPVLESYNIYGIRDQVVRKYFPEYDGTQKWKIVQPGNMLEKDSLNIYSLLMHGSGGEQRKRLSARDLRTIVGSTDVKQRTRMTTLYNIAEIENYIVAGTTNLSETMLGFYVKYGDGGVDIEPLGYLFKTYIYQLAEHLDIPSSIIERLPSPDTFSAEVGDDEFFFRMPYNKLDLFLWALRDNVPEEEIGKVLDIPAKKVTRIMNDLKHKKNISEHLRNLPASPDRTLP